MTRLWNTTKNRLPIALFLALFVAFAPGNAHAQSSKELLKQGNQQFVSGDYQSAYQTFKRGYEKAPSAVFLRSMAYALLKLRRHEQAQKLLREYLKKFSNKSDAKKIAETVKDLEIVVKTKFSVLSQPSGARVYIDTKVAGSVGTTPLRNQTVEPGKHTIIVSKAGYVDTSYDVNLKAGENAAPITITLNVPLRVNSKPKADVFVGSLTNKVGSTPYDGAAKPGNTTVYLKAPGYEVYKRDLKLASPGATVGPVELEVGVEVATQPTGALVLVDGRPVKGRTPLKVLARPGKHKVEVRQTFCKSTTQEIEFKPGTTPKKTIALKGSMLSMRTNVEGAELRINGKAVGKTPIASTCVPEGQASLSLTHPDRRELVGESISVGSNQMLTAQWDLGRKTWPIWVLSGVAVASTVGAIVSFVIAGNKQRDATDNIQVLATSDNGTQRGFAPCKDGSLVTRINTTVGGDVFTDRPILTDQPYQRLNFGPDGERLEDTKGIDAPDCRAGYAAAHAATAMTVIAATSASAALGYWLFGARHSTPEPSTAPRGAISAKKAGIDLARAFAKP